MTAPRRWAAAAAGLPALMLLAGCHVDMWRQPKAKAQRETPFFSDRREARLPVSGTIARGQLRTDEAFFTGAAGGKMVEALPFPVTRQVLERGRERFDINCSPCHGHLGYGDGMVTQRGLVMRRPPASYHTPRLRGMPVGHFYDVITNGFGVMYSHSQRIVPRDRWCITAYIRVLQLSQHAPAADVPAEEMDKLLHTGTGAPRSNGGTAR